MAPLVTPAAATISWTEVPSKPVREKPGAPRSAALAYRFVLHCHVTAYRLVGRSRDCFRGTNSVTLGSPCFCGWGYLVTRRGSSAWQILIDDDSFGGVCRARWLYLRAAGREFTGRRPVVVREVLARGRQNRRGRGCSRRRLESSPGSCSPSGSACPAALRPAAAVSRGRGRLVHRLAAPSRATAVWRGRRRGEVITGRLLRRSSASTATRCSTAAPSGTRPPSTTW